MDFNIFNIFNLLQLLPNLSKLPYLAKNFFKLAPESFWHTLTLAVFEFLLVESSTFRDHNLGANGTRCYWLIIFSKPFEWIEIEKYKFINFKTFTDKNTYCILADISNSDLGLHCFYFYLTTVSPFTPAENSSSQSHWVWQEKFT